jgi:hypothetical protein
MDMIRWLATNKVVLTVWGLGILAILLASIFGGGKKVESTAAVETKAVEEVVETSAEVTTPVVAAVAATGAAATTAVLAAVGTATETTEVVVDKASEVVTDAEAKVTDAAVEATDVVKVESQEVSEASPEEVVEASDLADKSTDDLLMMAREAYWDNGLDEAASLYSELITREPTVFEHKGELGNVFWRQGYPKKAAELYADIAEPMIAGGNGERVSNMVGFIGLFFPERATNIRKLLDAQ